VARGRTAYAGASRGGGGGRRVIAHRVTNRAEAVRAARGSAGSKGACAGEFRLLASGASRIARFWTRREIAQIADTVDRHLRILAIPGRADFNNMYPIRYCSIF